MLEISLRHELGAFRLAVDLSAGPGITALFGPSGSGKTSLINLVAGLMRPQQGHIAVDGRVLFDDRLGIDLPPEKRHLGYVFQDGRLFPHLSVRANLTFGQRRHRPDRQRIGFDDVVALLGLDALLERRPHKLSGGEKQRVAIGRALLADPRILLMDEPLASLDAGRKEEVLPFIHRLARHYRLPILYVSHSLDEILGLSDNLALLAEGRILAVGPTEDILSRVDLRHATGSGDAGTVIRATLSHHDESHGLSSLSLPGGCILVSQVDLPPGAAVRLRIHARDVALASQAPSHLSVRNVLKGEVIAVAPGPGHVVDILLDCGGTALWSQITELAQSELGFQPGMPAFALLKAVTIAQTDIVNHQPDAPFRDE
ncbi:MAG TPA: molybdenum ABC transporter ATP-binding protein [Rhodospirillaceae bacterium]|nr:molybdenum ABC transporter ATP-binding protein [Rhodospirillaceae bacterium]